MAVIFVCKSKPVVLDHVCYLKSMNSTPLFVCRSPEKERWNTFNGRVQAGEQSNRASEDPFPSGCSNQGKSCRTDKLSGSNKQKHFCRRSLSAEVLIF